MIFTDLISQNAKWYPDKIAIIFGEYRLTWKDLNKRANRVANSLIKAGIKKGENVIILNQNCKEYPEIMFGILKAGAAIVPLSTMLSPDMISLVIEDTETKIIFCGTSYFPNIEVYKKQSIENIQKKYIIIDGHADSYSSYEYFLNGNSDNEPNIPLSYNDTFMVIYSSGTTGIPKGIVHSYYGRLFLSSTVALEFRIHNESITLITTPLYTNMTHLIFLPTIMTCGTTVIMPSFDQKDFLELVQKENCTHTFMVPTQFIRVMAYPEFLKYDTSSMEVMVSAAAPLLKSTKLEILNKFSRTKLVELYGITEGISTILRPDEQFSRLGSVGKPRIGGDIRIIDDKGKEISLGKTGEIVGNNVSIMKGYYKKPEKTKQAMWVSEDEKEFVKTGDIGKLDEDGYLYILDRKKDMIISGGINIFPSDIEKAILQHSGVAETTVIGIPHKEWGETPLAIVVKKEEEANLTEDGLKKWINSKLAKYQRVDAVEFRSFLPRNALGKILKRELRTAYWKDNEI